MVDRTRPQPVTSHAPEAQRQTQARPARRGWEAGLQDQHGCSVRMDDGCRRADAPGKRQRPLRPATTPVMPDGERGHRPGCWTDGTEAAPTTLLDGGLADVARARRRLWASTHCSWLRGLLLPSTSIPSLSFSLSLFFTPGSLCGHHDVLSWPSADPLFPTCSWTRPRSLLTLLGTPLCRLFAAPLRALMPGREITLEGTAPKIPKANPDPAMRWI